MNKGKERQIGQLTMGQTIELQGSAILTKNIPKKVTMTVDGDIEQGIYCGVFIDDGSKLQTKKGMIRVSRIGKNVTLQSDNDTVSVRNEVDAHSTIIALKNVWLGDLEQYVTVTSTQGKIKAGTVGPHSTVTTQTKGDIEVSKVQQATITSAGSIIVTGDMVYAAILIANDDIKMGLNSLLQIGRDSQLTTKNGKIKVYAVSEFVTLLAENGTIFVRENVGKNSIFKAKGDVNTNDLGQNVTIVSHQGSIFVNNFAAGVSLKAKKIIKICPNRNPISDSNSKKPELTAENICATVDINHTKLQNVKLNTNNVVVFGEIDFSTTEIILNTKNAAQGEPQANDTAPAFTQKIYGMNQTITIDQASSGWLVRFDRRNKKCYIKYGNPNAHEYEYSYDKTIKIENNVLFIDGNKIADSSDLNIPQQKNDKQSIPAEQTKEGIVAKEIETKIPIYTVNETRENTKIETDGAVVLNANLGKHSIIKSQYDISAHASSTDPCLYGISSDSTLISEKGNISINTGENRLTIIAKQGSIRGSEYLANYSKLFAMHDIKFLSFDGNVTATSTHGSIDLAIAGDNCTLTAIQGNIKISQPLTNLTLSAGGFIDLELSPQQGARLTARHIIIHEDREHQTDITSNNLIYRGTMAENVNLTIKNDALKISNMSSSGSPFVYTPPEGHRYINCFLRKEIDIDSQSTGWVLRFYDRDEKCQIVQYKDNKIVNEFTYSNFTKIVIRNNQLLTEPNSVLRKLIDKNFHENLNNINRINRQFQTTRSNTGLTTDQKRLLYFQCRGELSKLRETYVIRDEIGKNMVALNTKLESAIENSLYVSSPSTLYTSISLDAVSHEIIDEQSNDPDESSESDVCIVQ